MYLGSFVVVVVGNIVFGVVAVHIGVRYGQ